MKIKEDSEIIPVVYSLNSSVFYYLNYDKTNRIILYSKSNPLTVKKKQDCFEYEPGLYFANCGGLLRMSKTNKNFTSSEVIIQSDMINSFRVGFIPKNIDEHVLGGDPKDFMDSYSDAAFFAVLNEFHYQSRMGHAMPIYRSYNGEDIFFPFDGIYEEMPFDQIINYVLFYFEGYSIINLNDIRMKHHGLISASFAHRVLGAADIKKSLGSLFLEKNLDVSKEKQKISDEFNKKKNDKEKVLYIQEVIKSTVGQEYIQKVIDEAKNNYDNMDIIREQYEDEACKIACALMYFVKENSDVEKYIKFLKIMTNINEVCEKIYSYIYPSAPVEPMHPPSDDLLDVDSPGDDEYEDPSTDVNPPADDPLNLVSPGDEYKDPPSGANPPADEHSQPDKNIYFFHESVYKNNKGGDIVKIGTAFNKIFKDYNILLSVNNFKIFQKNKPAENKWIFFCGKEKCNYGTNNRTNR